MNGPIATARPAWSDRAATPRHGEAPAAKALRGGRAVLALVVCIGLSACASAPPERFYRLPTPQPAAALPTAAGPVIAIGPVALPELFDRPQIVTEGGDVVSGNVRVTLSETHRWAEPLRPAIGRAVAAQLSAALGAPQVVAHPQLSVAEPAYRVTLNVQRFDAELGVQVNDDVLWTVRRTSDSQTRTGRSVVREPAAAAGYEAVVAAHGAALKTVARDVAQAIGELSKP